MRIGINVRHLSEPNTGLGIYMNSLLHAISKIDQKTQYILYAPPGTSIPDFGKNFIRCYCMTKGIHDFDSHFCDTREFSKSAPDIVHLQHCIVPRSKGIKKIHVTITLHDLMPYVFFSRLMIQHPELINLLSMKSFLSIPVFRQSAKKASHIFAVSNSTLRDCLNAFKNVSDKTTLTLNGVDPLFTRPAQKIAISQALHKYGISQPYLISFSGLTARKNTSRLVQAWLHLPPEIRKSCRLVITGEGSKKASLSKKLEKVRDHGIVFTGYASRDMLHALLSGAAASLYVSLYEGFGLPVLESLGCRVPVIASNISSLGEIMRDHVIHVDPFSRKEITHAMEIIFEKKHPAPDWHTVKRDLAKYSWEKSAETMIRVWRQLLA